MSDDSMGRIRLLVVDDEPLNRELLSRVLGRLYDVSEAKDAADALAVLEQSGEYIRVILCDQLMPGRMGTQLAEDVSARWPGTHFMLLTGYDDDPVVAEAVEKGHVHEVLAKPWRGKTLKELIKRRLADGDESLEP